MNPSNPNPNHQQPTKLLSSIVSSCGIAYFGFATFCYPTLLTKTDNQARTTADPIPTARIKNPLACAQIEPSRADSNTARPFAEVDMPAHRHSTNIGHAR